MLFYETYFRYAVLRAAQGQVPEEPALVPKIFPYSISFGSDPHSIGLSRNLCFTLEKSLISLDRHLIQCHAVRLVQEIIGWLVKADMAVVAFIPIIFSFSLQTVRRL